MTSGVSGTDFNSIVLEALKRGAALVDQHGPGAIHGFIAGLEYGAAMAPAPAAITVAQEKRRPWPGPATSIPLSAATPEPQPVPALEAAALPPDEADTQPDVVVQAPTGRRGKTGGPTQKERVLAAWRAGHRKPKDIEAATGIKNSNASVYLGELRKAGIISDSDPVTEEAPSEDDAGKPLLEADPLPPGWREVARSLDATSQPGASSASTNGEPDDEPLIPTSGPDGSASTDTVTLRHLDGSSEKIPLPSSESLPSTRSHGRPASSESPSPATTSSTRLQLGPPPKQSRAEMMARIGSFTLPTTKTPATEAPSSSSAHASQHTCTDDASPYGGM